MARVSDPADVQDEPVSEQKARRPLANSQLPAFPGPTVTLYAEQLARFRADYMLLLEFAADMTGKPAETLNMVDMERARVERNLPIRDAVIRYWAVLATQAADECDGAP